MDEKQKKPLTIKRHECIQLICDTLNCADIPAFVGVEILERILSEMRHKADIELKTDLSVYRGQEKGE